MFRKVFLQAGWYRQPSLGNSNNFQLISPSQLARRSTSSAVASRSVILPIPLLSLVAFRAGLGWYRLKWFSISTRPPSDEKTLNYQSLSANDGAKTSFARTHQSSFFFKLEAGSSPMTTSTTTATYGNWHAKFHANLPRNPTDLQVDSLRIWTGAVCCIINLIQLNQLWSCFIPSGG